MKIKSDLKDNFSSICKSEFDKMHEIINIIGWKTK